LKRGLENLASLSCSEQTPNCSACPAQYFCVYGRKGLSTQKAVINGTFIDLFCGAGGLSLGLEAVGLRPVLATDIDDNACATYRFNRPFLRNDQVIVTDISVLTEQTTDLPPVDLVVGGPPCQGFSTANRQRLSDDPRNHLYKDFIHVVSRVRAPIFIMENVVGMLRAAQSVALEFHEIGYAVKPFVVDAKECGLPQSRRRVFLLGVRRDDPSLTKLLFETFEKTLTEQKCSPRALWDSISDLPVLSPRRSKNATALEDPESGFAITKKLSDRNAYAAWLDRTLQVSSPHFLFNHRAKFNNERDVEIYKTLKPGENSHAESIREIMPYKERSHIFKDKFFKLVPDKICKTITAHMYYDCHMYIHPYQPRGLTPREAARIQGFPDGYFFLGTPNQWYRQVGNAVSPIVAVGIGRAVLGCMKALESFRCKYA